jgi:RNA polymerase sigma-70 factor, ECF subfamily
MPDLDRRSSDATLEALLAEHGERLRRVIARACPPELAAEREDIEQEARLRIWKALESGTLVERPASFIYRVALTATVDAWRRHRARPQGHRAELGEGGLEVEGARTEPVAPDAPPDTVAGARELGRRVRAAMTELVENRRLAVALHLQGFGVPEVARLTGWTEAAARKLVYRGLADLRARLREEGIDEDG